MADRMTTVHLDDIYDSPDNLREQIGDVSDLAASIEFIGLLEPLRVQKNGEGYKVIAGHRRLAALKELHSRGAIDPETKVVIGDKLDDEGRTAAMLIENMQRVDLSAKEEAEGVRRLIQEYGMTQADVAKNLGVTKDWVRDRVTLLNVPDYLFTTPMHSATDKTLPVASLVQFGQLPDDVQERLTKDDKVPTPYDIEDRLAKVKAKEKAARELKQRVKDGYIAVTEKQLKRIVKSEIGELEGLEFMVKSMTGGVTKISEYMYSHAKEPTIVLRQDFGGTLDKKVMYVLKESGYPKWYKAVIEGGRTEEAQAEDEVLDEYELACAEVDERNEQKMNAWADACFDARSTYVRDGKAAQLTADLLWHLVDRHLGGFNRYRIAKDASELLDIPVIDIPPKAEGEDDDVFRQRQKDTEAEQIESVYAYAKKNGTQLVRTVAAIHANDIVEVPERPEREDYPDYSDDEDDLDGF